MIDVKSSRIVVPNAVLEAVLSQEKVDAPPHSFYKYPARFSPSFAREAIKAFTKEGDTVVDPFCGGGTSLVEAMTLGRKAAGFDISSLAVFLSRVKTTPLSIHDKREILEWADLIATARLEKTVCAFASDEEEAHYLRNLPNGARACFETIIFWLGLLQKERQRRFVRLILLAVGQWALDCKTDVPDWAALRQEFCRRVKLLVEQHFDFMAMDRLEANDGSKSSHRTGSH